MSVHVSGYPIHLQKGVKLSREYQKSQKVQSTDRKMFRRDTLEISDFSKNREELMYRINHTVVQSATLFGDTRARILKEIREEKGHYDYSDIVNACGLSYAKLYAEIEERHESGNEQWYKMADGTLLTKEEEIEWLDAQYEGEVAWQKACTRIAAQMEVSQGRISEVPTKEIDELEDSLYQAKIAYIKLYQVNRQNGKPLTLQNFLFGSRQMYERLNSLGNL